MDPSGEKTVSASGPKDSSAGRFGLAAALLIVNFVLSDLGTPLVPRLVLLVTFTLVSVGGIGAILHRDHRATAGAAKIGGQPETPTGLTLS